MFVDTHCHLNMMVSKERDALLRDADFQHIDVIVKQAQAQGVTTIINVGTSLAETHNSIDIAKRYKNVWATAGLHPQDCSDDWYDDFCQMKKLVARKEEHKIIGIGETGLDYYRKPFSKDKQKDAFKAQIELALEYDLPLTVHVRDAADDLLRILEGYKDEARGVIHCFMQEQYVADTVIAWGWYLGIDGPIGYPKNQWLRDSVKNVGCHNLVLETDAPFLPPQQFRGKQNTPAYIPLVAQVVADVCEISLKECGHITSENVANLWRI